MGSAFVGWSADNWKSILDGADIGADVTAPVPWTTHPGTVFKARFHLRSGAACVCPFMKPTVHSGPTPAGPGRGAGDLQQPAAQKRARLSHLTAWMVPLFVAADGAHRVRPWPWTGAKAPHRQPPHTASPPHWASLSRKSWHGPESWGRSTAPFQAQKFLLDHPTLHRSRSLEPHFWSFAAAPSY